MGRNALIEAARFAPALEKLNDPATKTTVNSRLVIIDGSLRQRHDHQIITPPEADPPLLVDANAVLTFSITL